jgi:tRNA A-37 threonylcarbamoyl transferase component Bud32
LPAYSDRNGEIVRRILATEGWTLLQRRDVRKVRREVFLTGDGYVVKRYLHFSRPPRIRCPWTLEHRALGRLQGEGAPLPVGYVLDTAEGRPRATLVRRFVAGEPLEALDQSVVGEIASLLAWFHDAGVTTDDAHRHNFIRTGRGRLVFLDFGRARIFTRGNPLLFAGIAVDLHRFYRAALKRNDDLWEVFLQDYFRQSPFGPAANSLIRRLVGIDMRRYRWVKGPGAGSDG